VVSTENLLGGIAGRGPYYSLNYGKK